MAGELKRLPAVFYRSGNGREPVRDWLKTLSRADRRIVGFDIAVRLAGGHAGLPLAWRRVVGGAVQPYVWPYSPRDLLRCAGSHGSGACVREKDADNAGAGFEHRPPPAKGDRAMINKRIGSFFEDFLKDEGIHEEATARAIKGVLVWQIEQAMTEQGVSKSEMAKRMKTSRAQLDRLLDPENDKVQLDTVQRAAAAVGRTLHLSVGRKIGYR
jgi:predicted XRE-type DNA-binding protein